MMKWKSQTATEYLIILALVIVIALIVVVVLGGVPGIRGGVEKKVASVKLASDKIGVMRYALSNESMKLILRNNQYFSITINTLTIDEVACSTSRLPKTLGPGQQATIICTNINSSDAGTQYEYDLMINYTDISTNAVYVLDDLTIVGVVSGQSTRSSLIEISIDCPEGYIPVPGSSIYSTDDFCVMKYEAKNNGSDVAVSTAFGTPWVSISQTDAKAECEALGGGYHLITNEEWMTIARNVEQVGSNWYGGVVGTNYLYRGHTDNTPGNSLVASTDDDGYYGTGNSDVVGPEQKRTLLLSNGEVIWDITGNVWDWTDGEITCAVNDCDASEMPIDVNGYGDTSSNRAQYDEILTWGAVSRTLIAPSNASWDYNYGVGRVYLDADAASGTPSTTHAFRRGGLWYDGLSAGVFALDLSAAPSFTSSTMGFRCVYSQ